MLLLPTSTLPPLPSQPTDSGVEGQVWLGPTCTAEQSGAGCSNQPYEAQLTVTNLEGQIVAQGSSDADGVFHIPLAPGAYVLVPGSVGPEIPPFAKPIPFNVQAGTFTQLTVTYDSGIR